jgi:hypothetical protein
MKKQLEFCMDNPEQISKVVNVQRQVSRPPARIRARAQAQLAPWCRRTRRPNPAPTRHPPTRPRPTPRPRLGAGG